MKIIKDLRQNFRNEQGKKLSQEDLAKALNVSRSTVAMWETDGSVPDITSLQALADFFNVSTDYLLGRQVSSTAPPGANHGIDIYNNPDVIEICKLFEKLPDNKKALVLQMARVMLEDKI